MEEIKSFVVNRKKLDQELKRKGASSIDSVLKDVKDIETQSQERVTFFQQAELVIEKITTGLYPLGTLTAGEKKAIFYYLSVFSPVISRVIELHTKLPLSSLRLQKPAHEMDIVQDYIYDYFNKLIEDRNFKTELRGIIKNFWVFGEGVAFIEDDFYFLKDTVFKDDFSDITLPELDEGLRESLEDINNRYNVDPAEVKWKEKLKVLKGYLLDVNEGYGKKISIKNLDFFNVDNVKANTDIDYYIYSLYKSKYVQDCFSTLSTDEGKRKKTFNDLLHMGYSRGFLELHMNGETFMEVDNDPFNDTGVYVARLASSSDSINDSMLNRVLESAIQHLSAIRASNRRVELSYKIDRIVNAPGADEATLEKLKRELNDIAESKEGKIIAVNFDNLSVDELSLNIKENLDLDDVIERTEREQLTSLGMPEELLSGEGSYGGSFLKVELLSNEYVEFRNRLKDFIENQIFKPIAIKKGFLTVNDWGETIPLIPTLRFDKFSISRQSEDLALIRDMVQDKMLPVSVLLEHMGYNIEDIEQRLGREKFSLFKESMQELQEDAISDLSDKLSENPDFIKQVLEKFGLEYTPESEEDFSNNRRR